MKRDILPESDAMQSYAEDPVSTSRVRNLQDVCIQLAFSPKEPSFLEARVVMLEAKTDNISDESLFPEKKPKLRTEIIQPLIE